MPSRRSLVVVVGGCILVLAIVIGRSFFRHSDECVTPDELEFDDLPYIDVAAVLEQHTDDNGLAAVQRFTEAELERNAFDLVGYINTPEFRNRIHQRIGYVPESTRVVGRAYRTGERADWIYGGNLTPGRKHTGILQVNVPDCNTAQFEYRDPCTGEVRESAAKVGTMILFPTKKLYHRITEETGTDACTRFDIVFEFTETSWIPYARKTMNHGVERLKTLAFD